MCCGALLLAIIFGSKSSMPIRHRLATDRCCPDLCPGVRRLAEQEAQQDEAVAEALATFREERIEAWKLVLHADPGSPFRAD
jgi:hypothetical protein